MRTADSSRMQTRKCRFAISGPGVIAAAGNGDGQRHCYVSRRPAQTFPGTRLVVVRTSRQGGPIHLTATASGSERRDYRYPGDGGDSASRTALTSRCPRRRRATDTNPAGSHPAISYI